MKPAIPMIMLHGVAPDLPDRPPQMDHWLTPSLFERHLAGLRRNGFRFVFLDEVMRWKRGEIDLPRRTVALTFDDGYLDFWLYVYPLLRRYEAKATVFVNTDFIDGEKPPRVLGRDFPWGFLSWPEMREMRSSGLVDVQSHARTHTWYFTGPEMVDVHRPDLPWNTLRFLWWNRFPDRKPAWYREGRHQDLPWGLPVLKHEKSLLARIYRLPISVEEGLVSRVAESGGATFLKRKEWRETCCSWYRELLAASDGGVFETEEERQERLRNELEGSRTILSRTLGSPVRFLLCPGGSLSYEVIDLARAYGYFGLVVPSTRWPRKDRNTQGGDSTLFYRIGSSVRLRRASSDAMKAWVLQNRVLAEAGVLRHWLGARVLRGLRLAGVL